jgi:hypothetical protein
VYYPLHFLLSFSASKKLVPVKKATSIPPKKSVQFKPNLISYHLIPSHTISYHLIPSHTISYHLINPHLQHQTTLRNTATHSKTLKMRRPSMVSFISFPRRSRSNENAQWAPSPSSPSDERPTFLELEYAPGTEPYTNCRVSSREVVADPVRTKIRALSLRWEKKVLTRDRSPDKRWNLFGRKKFASCRDRVATPYPKDRIPLPEDSLE